MSARWKAALAAFVVVALVPGLALAKPGGGRHHGHAAAAHGHRAVKSHGHRGARHARGPAKAHGHALKAHAAKVVSPAAAKPVAGAAGRRARKAGAKLIPSPGPGAKSASVGPPTGQFFLASSLRPGSGVALRAVPGTGATATAAVGSLGRVLGTAAGTPRGALAPASATGASATGHPRPAHQGATVLAGARARRRGQAIEAMEGLAISDALTGVLNRGALEGRLASELARARRYGRPLGLLTFDVAGLKAINDAHGHSAGDEVLRGVAGILTASVRDHDLVGRMGGDEYAVVVTEQSRAGTEKVLDRIRSQIPQRRTALGLSTHWGLSAGVAEFPNDGETAEELLEAADRRLYLSRGIHIQPVS
ncbi:MAG: GGDEF domain-containing protein [Actinobacteria bacterium]|nr:MAG: GGDEF domain-containing protein [Actinomycetota bacterium]